MAYDFWGKMQKKLYGVSEYEPIEMPDSIRDGNDVPDYMLKAKRCETGVFFGTKKVSRQKASTFEITLSEGWPYYVGKPAGRDGHVLVIGGAGSGKSSCIAIPTLETWDGTIFAIDIKGELSAYWNKMNSPIRPAKFFSFTDKKGFARYDPFYFLSQSDKADLVQNAREIAQAIIQIPPNVLEPFWPQAAQHILTATLLYGYSKKWSFNDTLKYIQKRPLGELIAEIAVYGNEDARMHVNQFVETGIPQETLEGIDLEETSSEGEAELQHSAIVKALSGSRTLEGISADLSNRVMVFATDPRIRTSFSATETSGNSVRWEDLEKSNIFMRIDEDKLGQWDGAITLMLTQLIRTLERRADIYSEEGKKKKLPPVLLLLDEFPRLGKVDVIQNAVSTLRSKGVTICIVMQSLAQLDKTYGVESRRIIVDNCQYKAILHVTDPENQKVFSDMIGSFKTNTKSYSDSNNDHFEYHKEKDFLKSSHDSQSHTLSETREPVIYPHEFANLGDELVLIVPEGFCRVSKEPYYKAKDIPVVKARYIAPGG